MDEISNNDNEKIEKKKSGGSFCNFMITWICFMLLFSCIFTLHYIPTSSMRPTIEPNSFAICLRLPFLTGNPCPKHGDIVSFRSNDEDSKIFIKRVIGLPGDTVSFEDGKVYLNGEELKEDYLAYPDSTYAYNADTYTVPEGHFFVLGDNRTNSADSRFMEKPFIEISSIYSKFIIAFPSFLNFNS